MRKPIAFLIVTGIIFLVFQAFILHPAPAPGIPDDVMDILSTSCYGCHSNDASSDKAKGALNFDEWENYKASKMISKLSDISEVVGESKMPPEKFLKNNPEKAPTDAQRKTITDWADKETARLMEGN